MLRRPRTARIYVVRFEPGEKHRHCASPATATAHIPVQEAQGGKAVDWMAHVGEEQYPAASGAPGPAPDRRWR